MDRNCLVPKFRKTISRFVSVRFMKLLQNLIVCNKERHEQILLRKQQMSQVKQKSCYNRNNAGILLKFSRTYFNAADVIATTTETRELVYAAQRELKPNLFRLAALYRNVTCGT